MWPDAGRGSAWPLLAIELGSLLDLRWIKLGWPAARGPAAEVTQAYH